MKFIKLKARFQAPDTDLAEELICNIFFSFNLKGVVCDVPIEEPDEGFGTQTLEALQDFSITGYLPLIDASASIIESMKKQFRSLSQFNIQVDTEDTVVDEKEWADAWKDFFEVTPITDSIIVKPAWKNHAARNGEIIIHLDPGMAFGTGTHPTTAMCIQLIEAYLNPGDTFLDVGTGSGILMITASKLGAKKITGIDTDEVAISVTRQNLEKNNIPRANYQLACTTIDKTPPKRYRVIAANIIAQVIVDIAGMLAQRMDDQSTAILSGIIQERMPDVRQALDDNNLEVIEKKTSHEWVALAVKKKSSH